MKGSYVFVCCFVFMIVGSFRFVWLMEALRPTWFAESNIESISPAAKAVTENKNRPTDPGELTRSFLVKNCSNEGFEYMRDVVLPRSTTKKIPPLVHQTSKFRCVKNEFVKLMNQWKFPGFSYYFWDDEAMMSLLRLPFDEFPGLGGLVENCLETGTLKGDVWRYLVLYEYGGIYADLDSIPASFNPETHLHDDDEAYFVMEQYALPSQYFMAIAPKHPVLYYTIQLLLATLYEMPDTRTVAAPGVTGPHALMRGFQRFLREGTYSEDEYYKRIIEKDSFDISNIRLLQSITYMGQGNWTVRIDGNDTNSDDIVVREGIDYYEKRRGYHEMNMTHFHDEVHGPGSNVSCMNALRLQASKNAN